MPSSVVFAALVLAWLVVLVPVVARRRQMVPRPAEADLSARVLRRTAGIPMIEEVPVADAHRQGRAGGSRTAGSTAVAERDEAPAPRDAAEPAPVDRERVLRRAEPEPADDRYDDELDDDYDGESDESDESDESYDEFDDDDRDDVSDRLPRPYRPGRGGFDPDAAAAAAHARYSFRQRVALGLIAVAVLSALAALVVTSMLWWLHVVTDVVLIGYLVFLRRQTRIEEEVRARRAARQSGERRALEARRARQDEHDARMAAYQADAWDAEYEVADDRDVEDEDVDDLEAEYLDEVAPRWIAPRTPAPPVPADMELVVDSEDDPAFHDLEGERVPSYRRAAAGA